MSDQIVVNVLAIFGFVFGITGIVFSFVIAWWIGELRRRIEALEAN